MCHVSDVKCQMSDFKGHMPHVSCHMTKDCHLQPVTNAYSHSHRPSPVNLPIRCRKKGGGGVRIQKYYFNKGRHGTDPWPTES